MKTDEFINVILDSIRCYVPEKANTSLKACDIEKNEFEDSFDNKIEIMLSEHDSTWKIDGIFSVTFNDNLYHISHNIFEYDIVMKVLLNLGLVKMYIAIVWRYLHNTNMMFRIIRTATTINILSSMGDPTALNTLLFTDWEKLTEERFDETEMDRCYFERYYFIKTEKLNRVFRMKLCEDLNNDNIFPECKAVMLRWLKEHGKTTEGDMKL